MFSLKVPNPEEPKDSKALVPCPKNPEKAIAPKSSGEQRAQIVMSVDLTDPVSRARARKTVDELTSGGVSAARSRMLDKQILALAQADSGGSRISTELQRLASKARELNSSVNPRRRGLLGRLFDPEGRNSDSPKTTLEELASAISALTSSAEVLRQNNVALDGYESDIGAESRLVREDIERIEDFHSALIAAIERAKEDGTAPEVIHFVSQEVLYPLEGHRQNLQSLLAVNQQAAVSLVILRETNAMLIKHIRLITVAARNSLEIAKRLSRQSAQRQGEREEKEWGRASDAPSNLAALQQSLDELFRTLEEHDAWRREAATKTSDAIDELRDLSDEVFEGSDPRVVS